MSTLIFCAVALVGWFLSAAVFEAGYKILKSESKIKASKFDLCRFWWGILCVISLATGTGTFLVNLPLLLAVGLSHIDLVTSQDEKDIITLTMILKNIPPAMCRAADKIKPYLK